MSFGSRAPLGPTGEYVRPKRFPQPFAMTEKRGGDRGRDGEEEAVWGRKE